MFVLFYECLASSTFFVAYLLCFIILHRSANNGTNLASNLCFIANELRMAFTYLHLFKEKSKNVTETTWPKSLKYFLSGSLCKKKKKSLTILDHDRDFFKIGI